MLNSAIAGPPFVTDDPEPVAYRHWEVNYALTKTWHTAGTSIGIPSVDINYGVIPDVQLHIQPRYSREIDGASGQGGFDDTEVGVKYRFLNREDSKSSTMVGVYPIYRLPTGNTKLGPDRRMGQFFLPLWFQLDADPWTIYGGPGYRINPGTGNKNSIFTGATVLYRLSEFLQLGGEVFHETSTSDDAKSTTGFNVGGIRKLTEDYNLLFSAGKGLQNASSTNQFSVYLAIQAHF
jgi:hypothetical protein